MADTLPSPGRYRKRPVVIEACQWDGTPECADRLTEWSSGWARPFVAVWKPKPALGMRVQTLEGEHTATVGDWLIRGVKGEYYFCKPDIFEATYEPA